MLEKAKTINVKRHLDVLHSIAELGFDLPKTTEYIKNELISFGYSVAECGGGIVTEIGKGNKTILLRADMDALPFENGAYHACGHDMHSSMLLGTAELIKQYEDDLSCRVKFMFQPAEEMLQGADRMISCGVLDGVDAAVMLHVLSAVPFKTGTVIIPPVGVGAPSADMFMVNVFGKGCHGSTPWLGSDIVSAVNCMTMLYNAIPRSVSSPSSASVLSIGSVNYGDAPNVIADSAVICGSFRTFDNDIRDNIRTRIVSITDGIAKALQIEYNIDFNGGCPCFVNDKHLCEWSRKRIAGIIGADYVIDASELSSGGGSEDFAYISQKVPSVMLTISAGCLEDGYTEPLHSRNVKFDTDVLPYGTAVLTDFALSYFK